jgi:hypothetical protein
MLKLRIDTTLPVDAPAWFAKPGEQPPAFNHLRRGDARPPEVRADR